MTVAACASSETALRGGIYSTNLEECTRTAKNLCESIECENHYRSAAGRFPREIPAHCLNARPVILLNKGFDNDGGQWSDASADTAKGGNK